MKNSIFCSHHKKIPGEEHKSRWIRMFLLGADGNPFLYKYDESKKKRILDDLANGTIILTQEDIDKIPAKSRYMDIYILLVEAGIITLKKNNIHLYHKCLRYLAEFLTVNESNVLMNFTPLAVKIKEMLILKDTDYLYQFLGMLISTKYWIQPRLPALKVFLESILDSDAARKLSWEPIASSLVGFYEKELAKEHALRSYMCNEFIPKFTTLYKQEKQNQKARTNQFKEELMAVCWHPDRFVDYCLDEEEKAEIKMLF